MNKRIGWSLAGVGLALCVLSLGTGCLMGTKTMPLYVLYRQTKNVERDYHMTPTEAETAIKQAFEDLGWTYRYSTNVGEMYTIYGRTECRKHVVVDIDPKKDRESEVKIDVMIGQYGDFEKSITFHNAISGSGPILKQGADGTYVVKLED